MAKIIRKSDIYSLETVDERISFYSNKIKETTDPEKLVINSKLLAFWVGYKTKNFS